MAKYKILKEFLLNGIIQKENSVVELNNQQAALKSIQKFIHLEPIVTPADVKPADIKPAPVAPPPPISPLPLPPPPLPIPPIDSNPVV